HKGSKQLAFDNMHDRPIQGHLHGRNMKSCSMYSQDATGIFVGVLFSGSGTVSISHVVVTALLGAHLDDTKHEVTLLCPHGHKHGFQWSRLVILLAEGPFAPLPG
ncbi:MAG TPA: hypothetical protein VF783_09000, partial [Terriglobales bacterium]